jgi:septum formation protein
VSNPHDLPMKSPPIVLASTSRYRRELLGRVVSKFSIESPEVEEHSLPGESPAALAMRLARAKAQAVAGRRHGIIIGGDQVAEVDGRALGKPGSSAQATEQLQASSGRLLMLHTAVCVQVTADGSSHAHLSTSAMQYRKLTRRTIERYVEQDDPVDSAGSFKFESRGIALFESVSTEDPTAIQGLPLIWLCTCLQSLGIELL